MNRPLHVWTLFALCAALVLATLGGLTLNALKLDDAGRKAAQEAEIEGRVRLALWRMDSALALLLAQENARPWYDYDAFHPAERAFTSQKTALPEGDVYLPSPLLGSSVSNVLLHFQFDHEGRFNAPGIPSKRDGELPFVSQVARENADLAATRLTKVERLMAQKSRVAGENSSWSPATEMMKRYGLSSTSSTKTAYNRDIAADAAANQLVQEQTPAPVSTVSTNFAGNAGGYSQGYLNDSEQRARANVFQNSQMNARNAVSQQSVPGPMLKAQPERPPRQTNTPTKPPRAVGLLAANWLSGELVLTRRVEFSDAAWRVQGCWLDWPALRAFLLSNVRDLIPQADLQPAIAEATAVPDGRHLVALPIRLETGPVAVAIPSGWSPIRFTLALAWIGVFLAAVAVALLLHGTLSLSERRASFVSAVTHELRTPLTTFQMYSEMLADDMVTEPARRKSYLETLRVEAGRLGHLVENVLAYARLERGRARERIETVTVADLLRRAGERLAGRATQAGLVLETDAGEMPDLAARTDVGAVEQILFNLVDNACKYAAPDATHPALHLEVLPPERKFVRIRVRDHGPGIDPEVAVRLFQPFSKSARQAADSAPGVGLGLALCRRLARGLGGDLLCDAEVNDGAAFILRLPRATAGPS